MHALRSLRHDPQAGHPLATTIEQIDAPWLTAVLRGCGCLEAAHVTQVTSTPIGVGLLGSNYRLDVEYSQTTAAPRSLVAKLASSRPESRATGQALGIYVKEARFYRELAPTLAIRVPRTYFADLAEDGSTFCLLFEDLMPARVGDQLGGGSLADAERAVDAAAALHGPRWGDPTLCDEEYLQRGPSVALYIGYFKKCSGAVRQIFGTELGQEVFAQIDGLAPLIERYYALATTPLTIVHHDFRLDNMLFDACGGTVPLVVLDWQTIMLAPGATDVAFFLNSSLDVDVRRATEERLVRRYHDALQTHGVRGYAWDDCWRDYGLYAAHGLVQTVIAVAQASRTERGDRMLVRLLRGHAQHMIDRDTLGLIARNSAS